MSNQFYQFLNSIGMDLSTYDIFKDGEITKVAFLKSKETLKFVLKINNIPPKEFFNQVELIEKNSSTKVIFEFVLNSDLIDSKEKIIDFIKDIIFKQLNNLIIETSIKNIEFDIIEDQLNLSFLSVILLENVKKEKNLINILLKKFGLNYQINLVINKEKLDKEMELLKEETSNNIEKSFNQIKQSLNNTKKQERNKNEVVEIKYLKIGDTNVKINGEIFSITKNERQKLIVTFFVSDQSSNAISVKIFENKTNTKEILNSFNEGDHVEIIGTVEYDDYFREKALNARSIKKIENKNKRTDDAPNKRVELHVHTKMSTMDGVSGIDEYVEEVASWGHSAIALTDHGNVQAYPTAFKAAKKHNVKLLYGLEAYMVDQSDDIVMKPCKANIENSTFIVFDLETTGLSSRLDEIIEIGAIKVKNGLVIEKFHSFVKPNRKLTQQVKALTNIEEKHLENAPLIKDIFPKFLEFIQDFILVAHNAYFDVSFLKETIEKLGIKKLSNSVIDTLALSRTLYSQFRLHNLGSVARRFNIEYDEEIAHRADYDAEILFHVFENLLREAINNHDIKCLSELNNIKLEDEYKKVRPKHVNILAKNQLGLKKIYELVSISSTQYLLDVPRIPREYLIDNRENLLIGSSCFNGEVFDIAMTKSKKELLEAVEFYDYIEIQPPANYSYLIDTQVIEDEDKLEEVIKLIIEAAKEKNKIIVATSDAHYLSPKEKIFRNVYISAQSVGGKRHPLYDFKKRVKENPNQHLRTTNEMLEEFSFLDDNLREEIVIKNTNLIADMIESIEPLKKETYTPKIEGAEEKLINLVWNKAHYLYGEKLPQIVEDRINKELNSIIANKFSVIYYISHLLVKKSVSDGYLVGSRGSVGSSIVAYLAEITEVNALSPHYLCTNCKYSDFSNEENKFSGYDLKPKKCPICGNDLLGEGQNIVFETFLGFKGDKVPDIDLNFSSEYQALAHDYTKELFGEKNVFRAGTIGTVAEKTAYGYVKNYIEELDSEEIFNRAQLTYLAKGCEGVKRTTGQHPGGIIIVPDEMEIHDFTPYQYPADDSESNWYTTHFDFHAIENNLLKLDILGHVDPTALKMLSDLTGVDPTKINLSDEKLYSLFTSTKVLNLKEEEIYNDNAVAGIPEFGTVFVKGMLSIAKPKTFAELVQISGLSHGTDVWVGNALELIKSNTSTLMEVIGCRDDIMIYLISQGLEKSIAFKIMEDVRKGRGLSEDFIKEMKDKNVPQWYIESCIKIKYMFPKAHAVAYVMMALRVAWFKIYYPLEYYAVFFSTRCEAYEIDTMIKGYHEIKASYNDYILRRNKKDASLTNKDHAIALSLENALEMTARGYEFENIDLYKSDSKTFIINEDTKKIIPPFMSIDGIGINAANSVVNARKDGVFISVEDIIERTLLNTTNIKKLENLGVLKGLQEENQMSLDLF